VGGQANSARLESWGREERRGIGAVRSFSRRGVKAFSQRGQVQYGFRSASRSRGDEKTANENVTKVCKSPEGCTEREAEAEKKKNEGERKRRSGKIPNFGQQIRRRAKLKTQRTG